MDVHRDEPTVHKNEPTVHKHEPTVHKDERTLHKDEPSVHTLEQGRAEAALQYGAPLDGLPTGSAGAPRRWHQGPGVRGLLFAVLIIIPVVIVVAALRSR